MMLAIRTESRDPWHNLAIEELCLDQLRAGGRILFLWQSSDTVVIGKNQNPWLECSLTAMESGGAKLARRLSGGGAVFHDEGNLNYAFFIPRREYKDKPVFDIVIKALKRFGVQAEVMGKSSLAVGGRKISGNAFCYRRDSVLHHGTLLVSTDLDKMNRYLVSAHRNIRSRAIGSKPAPVVNLAEINESISMPQLAVVLAETAATEWSRQIKWGGDEGFDAMLLKTLEEKYRSWEWRFGMTPRFEVDMSWRFKWGSARVRLLVEKSVIRESEVEMDADYKRIAMAISQALNGTRFSEREIVACLRKQAPAFRENDAVEFARWLVGS